MCIPSIFVFYVDKNQADNPWRQRVEVWISLVRVSAMAKHRVWIIKFLEPANFKYTYDNTPVRCTGCLASLATRHPAEFYMTSEPVIDNIATIHTVTVTVDPRPVKWSSLSLQ
jgi:hypothetical protein